MKNSLHSFRAMPMPALRRADAVFHRQIFEPSIKMRFSADKVNQQKNEGGFQTVAGYFSNNNSK